MLKLLFQKKIEKFKFDSIYYSNQDFELTTNGVFLGTSFNDEKELALYLIEEYQTKGFKFIKNLRGSFSITLHDKKQQISYVYTNHVGDKRIYYFKGTNEFIVSDSIKEMKNYCDQKRISVSLDQSSAYQLLTFGYLLHDNTLIAEFKRLLPGHFIKYENETASIHQYFILNYANPSQSVTENDIIENIDSLFRKAVILEYKKDTQYNLKHITSLSGGLDCRMNTWVANALNFSNITNFTFSQSGYLDQTIAQQIASDLNHEWIFKSLDHGDFLKDVEKIIELTEATTSYSNHCHSNNALTILNFQKFGVLHTGQIGDVMISSFMSENQHNPPYFAKYSSNKLLHKVSDDVLKNYENQELFLLYNRGFNGALAGHTLIQHYTEVASPFLDVDFMNYCLSIPLKLRKNHNIYKKWIIKKYPKAADYIWESLGTTIRAKTLNIRGKTVPIQKLPRFVWKGMELQLGLRSKTDTSSAFNMNPFDYWYRTNPLLPGFFNTYYQENIHRIPDPELQKDCELLFTGTTVEKMQVLSLLAALKLIWD